MESESPIIDRSSVHDHYWRWFEYHAKQRYESFRIFIVQLFLTPAGIFAVFYAKVDVYESSASALFIAVALIIESWLCLIFFFIDRRNEKLVKLGEAGLRIFEARSLQTRGFPTVLIEDESQEPENDWFHSHNKLLKALYFTGIIVFGVCGLLSLFRAIWIALCDWGCPILFCPL